MYVGVVYVAWQTIRRQADSFGSMLAFGVASMLSLQAAINMAVATVSVPTKGLSLPLVSAGGTGLVITAAALGVMCSVAREEPETEPALAESSKRLTPALVPSPGTPGEG
jgi:cell division protein FtsW